MESQAGRPEVAVVRPYTPGHSLWPGGSQAAGPWLTEAAAVGPAHTQCLTQAFLPPGSLTHVLQAPHVACPPLKTPAMWQASLIFSFFNLQGASEQGLEKIPEPIKEATALFYGEEELAK